MKTVEIDKSTSAANSWNDSMDNMCQSPIVPDEFNHGSSQLQNLYQDLTLLWNPEEDEERPALDSYQRALELVQQIAYALMQKHQSIPRGYVGTVESGGVRIEWWHEKTHCVILSVHGCEPSKDYVFSKFGADDKGAVNKRVFPNRIAGQLARLIDNQPTIDG